MVNEVARRIWTPTILNTRMVDQKWNKVGDGYPIDGN